MPAAAATALSAEHSSTKVFQPKSSAEHHTTSNFNSLLDDKSACTVSKLEPLLSSCTVTEDTQYATEDSPLIYAVSECTKEVESERGGCCSVNCNGGGRLSAVAPAPGSCGGGHGGLTPPYTTTTSTGNCGGEHGGLTLPYTSTTSTGNCGGGHSGLTLPYTSTSTTSTDSCESPFSGGDDPGLEDDGLREACGVFGCVLAEGQSPPATVYLAKTIMDGLIALQHRGQESAGIVTSGGRGAPLRQHRGVGLVSTVFTPDIIAHLTGVLGLGHTRYSTAGGGALQNAQPFVVHTRHGTLALAHNGELVNASSLRKTVLERGVGLSTCSDSELITQILSLTPLRGEHHGGADWQARIRHLMEATPTSYSLGLMNEDKIYGVRDPFGNRPLCVGLLRELDDEGISLACGDQSRVLGYVLSSESCAFAAVGATFLREVMPGEIVELSPHGVRRVDVVFRPQTYPAYRPLAVKVDKDKEAREDSPDKTQDSFVTVAAASKSLSNGTDAFLHDIENVPPAFCIFEYVYFARPDSYFEGQQVYAVRQRCGRQLALEAPAQADIVSCVPESATPAARGFAMELGLPYVDVLHKSRYVGRTFIQPSVTARKRGVAHKFSVITENVRGQRVVLVDDSVVRGTTIRPIVRLIRDAGAKEVHFRVASPPIRHPCYMGINIPTREELVANKVEPERLAAHFGVDSLVYLSLEGLVKVVRSGAKGAELGHCTACLSGHYPVRKEW